MKSPNNLIEKRKKISFHEKIIPKLFILALPIIIASPIIPLTIIFAPPQISHICAAVTAVYISLILLTLSISLFFSSNTLTRLVGIPINFIMIMIGFIIYKLKLYLLLLNTFSLGEPFILTSKIFDKTIDLFIPLAIVGIWITILPIIIYFLHLFFKSTKKKNLTNTIKAQGYIKSITDTHTKINNNRVYHIILHIQPETGQPYVAEKNFIIPNHIIHSVSLGNTVELLIDYNNPQEIYIQTNYGLL